MAGNGDFSFISCGRLFGDRWRVYGPSTAEQSSKTPTKVPFLEFQKIQQLNFDIDTAAEQLNLNRHWIGWFCVKFIQNLKCLVMNEANWIQSGTAGWMIAAAVNHATGTGYPAAVQSLRAALIKEKLPW